MELQLGDHLYQVGLWCVREDCSDCEWMQMSPAHCGRHHSPEQVVLGCLTKLKTQQTANSPKPASQALRDGHAQQVAGYFHGYPGKVRTKAKPSHWPWEGLEPTDLCEVK